MRRGIRIKEENIHVLVWATEKLVLEKRGGNFNEAAVRRNFDVLIKILIVLLRNTCVQSRELGKNHNRTF